jgi:PTS system fructose-specific IIC component
LRTLMIGGANPILVLAIILLGGLFGGWLAHRIRLPRIVGQIVVGIALGPSVANLFTAGAVSSLGVFTQFALGFIALTVGEHLNVRTLRNAGKRLFLLLLAESLITPLIVTAAAFSVTGSLWLPLLLGTMAVSTAPATVVALIKETRSKGVFVKTLIAAVAFNNISCIVMFSFARTIAVAGLASGGGAALAGPLLRSLALIGASLLLGTACGAALIGITRHEVRGSHLAAASVVALLLVCGLSVFFRLPVLLSCLSMGVVIANLAPRRSAVGVSTFENMETVIFALFFTIAGMGLELGHLAEAGALAAVVVAARFAGKLISANVGMRLAGATLAVRRYLGLALLPQAGVAVGLILLVREDPGLAPLHDIVLTAGLTSVMVNELFGSLAAHFALKRSGEIGKDRPRLMDFIEEQHIVTGFEAASMEEAVEKLADHMMHTHDLKIDRPSFIRSILERERQASTCLGSGLAIPHGIVEGRETIMGVMGLSSRGLDFETPDGRPVHCIVLLATPESQRARHLEVMSGLARMVARSPELKEQLFSAESPAHAHDVLHAEEAENFNYYLTA